MAPPRRRFRGEPLPASGVLHRPRHAAWRKIVMDDARETALVAGRGSFAGPGSKGPGGWLRRLRVAVTLLGLSGVSWLATPLARAEPPLQNARVLSERDFSRDPELAAGADDVVLLELECGSRRGTLHENRARYRLNAGPHTFCLDGPALVRLLLENEVGRVVLRLHRDGRDRDGDRPVCAQTVLPSGLYELRAFHDASVIPP